VQDLQTPLPVHPRQPPADGFVRHDDSPVRHGLHRRYGQRGILTLMPSLQIAGQGVPIPALAAIGKGSVPATADLDFFAQSPQGRPPFPRHVFDCLPGAGRTDGGHTDAAGRNNRRFFSGDIPKALSQILLMIPSHIGDDRHRRLKNPCRIQSAAHAHLDHGDVDLFLSEMKTCQNREKFKIGQRFVKPAVNLSDCRCQIPLGNHFAINPDPFPDIHQVWRGVKTDGIPGRR